MTASAAGVDGDSFCGYAFRDPALLRTALTHRSAASLNNERLEFLGDAVLGQVIAQALFQHCAAAGEGVLTRLRAHLVKGESLAKIAREIGLSDALHMGPGELKTGGYRRSSVLADTLEALLGAVLVDGGHAAAETVILRLFDTRLRNLPTPDELKDPKTRLQEWLQANSRPLPEYAVVEESGADHQRQFVVRCQIGDSGEAATAGGRSRRRAEQAAAQALLAQMDAVR